MLQLSAHPYPDVYKRQIRSYPIAPINKAKISDFLWVVENDFSNAKIAETAYCEHLKNTGAFADHIMAINRILFISKKIGRAHV